MHDFSGIIPQMGLGARKVGSTPGAQTFKMASFEDTAKQAAEAEAELKAKKDQVSGVIVGVK